VQGFLIGRPASINQYARIVGRPAYLDRRGTPAIQASTA
jgi:hypothetical protein